MGIAAETSSAGLTRLAVGTETEATPAEARATDGGGVTGMAGGVLTGVVGAGGELTGPALGGGLTGAAAATGSYAGAAGAGSYDGAGS
ncbi:hypothetical protein ACFQZ4_24510 [Catellatospora coxensis]